MRSTSLNNWFLKLTICNCDIRNQHENVSNFETVQVDSHYLSLLKRSLSIAALRRGLCPATTRFDLWSDWIGLHSRCGNMSTCDFTSMGKKCLTLFFSNFFEYATFTAENKPLRLKLVLRLARVVPVVRMAVSLLFYISRIFVKCFWRFTFLVWSRNALLTRSTFHSLHCVTMRSWVSLIIKSTASCFQGGNSVVLPSWLSEHFWNQFVPCIAQYPYRLGKYQTVAQGLERWIFQGHEMTNSAVNYWLWMDSIHSSSANWIS